MKTLFSIIMLIPWCQQFAQTGFLDSIDQAIENLQGTKRIEHLYQLAEDHAPINLSESRQLAEEGLRLAQTLQEEQLIFDGYLLLGDISKDIPGFAYSDSMFHRAMRVAEKMKDPGMILQAKYGLAKCVSHQGMWTEANTLHDEIIALASEVSDSLMLARGYMGKGLNYEKMSAFETALQYHYKALAIYEAMDDRYRAGIVHTNIGMAFLRLHRDAEALAEFQIAYQISEQEDDMEGIMINTLNIGVGYQRLKKFDQATEAYHKSLEMATRMGSLPDIALLTENLGTTAMRQGKYAEARTLLERAMALKDSIAVPHDLPHTLNSLAEVSIHLGDYDKALLHATEAGRLANTYNRRDQLSVSHRILSEAYAAKTAYAKAYDHLRLHKLLSDSLFSDESDKAISNLKISYETTQKENQITNLTAENKRRKTTQWIYLGLALLVFLTGASLTYALYLRRTRDKMVLAKERELHELQNRFFANISHEFRTPLTLILGPVHNLRKKFKGTPEESPLRTVQKNAERLLLLINQILDLTKFDKKVLELKKETFNVTRMIKGVCSSFDSLAEDRGIHYTYDIGDDLTLFADMRRLEVVLINLISNAFKFTPDNGSITVHAGIDASGNTFIMQVKDSGTGIAAERLPHIFDRYYHDDRDAHSDFEGAGIGLALSKNIVEMHEGSISVQSQRHVGSVFTVTLPYTAGLVTDEGITAEVKEIQDAKPSEQAALVPEPVSSPNGEMPLILLVEDRKDMREYITSLLQQSYQLLEAPDAFQGREMALEHIPDIIISDVMMPRKSGLELCRELKTDMRTSHIPVLLLTAKSSPEDRLSGLETEADIYLTKPFIPQELELHLRNLIASRKKIREYFSQHRQIEPAKMSFNSVDEQFLKALTAQLEANFAQESFSVEQLADLMNLSRSQLHRKLSALTGQAPNRLIRTYRLKRAFDMVSSNAATIAEIAFHVGFGSPAYFTKCFVEEFGITPGEIRNRIGSIESKNAE